MAWLDPTTIRMSRHFLLSDFMGCDTVYRRNGAHNRIEGNRDRAKLAEGHLLAETLDELVDEHGPCSVSYGYISPSLSQLTCGYQDPSKPSYHRWDKGAAADVNFHRRSLTTPPIETAFAIDTRGTAYSRMITYSESEWICFATQRDEAPPRRALYENRFVGRKEPKFIKYPVSPARRAEAMGQAELAHPWRGRGWPSYHGKGRRQYHHLRLSNYVVLSDLLYDAEAVHRGRANRIPSGNTDLYASLTAVGCMIDALVDQFGCRFSVVRGVRASGGGTSWDTEGVNVELVPHNNVSARDVVDFAQALPQVTDASLRRMRSGIERVKIYV